MTQYAQPPYTVIDHMGKVIGVANNFGEAKKIHRESLPKDIYDYYAGIAIDPLKFGEARPCYDEELPSDIADKYNLEF